jgi:signal transduction histidine kinase
VISCANTASFTMPVIATTAVTITAAFNLYLATTEVFVLPAQLSSLDISPSSILGGSPATGTVTLNGIGAQDRMTHLAEVVEAAVTTARLDALERGVRLTSDVQAAKGDLVEADATRMQQVIGNILSNAIKFTPSGKQIDLRLERVDHNVRISVKDEGEGIDPTFLPYVFDRLRQADASAKRSGLGLGLAIARHIVELHHGVIDAESEGLGKGARFTVTLPLAEQANAAAPSPRAGVVGV